MRRAIIHLGTHKTGSSAFQQFMVERRAWLRGQGVEPYIEDRPGAFAGANASSLAHDVLRPGVVTGSRFAGVIPAPSRARLYAAARHVRGFAAGCAGRDVLISAEAFGFLREAGELRRLRLMLGPGLGAIVPLVAFRAEAGWRASWRAQIARNPGMTPAMMADPAFPLLADWWFDTAAIRACWAAAAGAVAEVDYDAAVARDGDAIPALLAAIGLPAPPGAPIRANVTPANLADDKPGHTR